MLRMVKCVGWCFLNVDENYQFLNMDFGNTKYQNNQETAGPKYTRGPNKVYEGFNAVGVFQPPV